MKEKQVLAAASHEKQKYFFEPECSAIPKDIQEEIRTLCVTTAQKLSCTFVIRVGAEGRIYFETVAEEGDFDFDEIGAELEIKKIKKEYKELLNSLGLWCFLLLDV